MPADPREELNATVTARTEVAPGLVIFRVEPDGELFPFEAGQYCVLGLPSDAPRVVGSGPEETGGGPPRKRVKMVRRAYSIASSSRPGRYLEFYVTLVRSGELTPRLFALARGDRIWPGPKATGLFTLREVPPDQDLHLLCTGTGLAPYMSMLRSDLLEEGETRRVVVAHGARYSWDLGCRSELESLAARHPRFTYIPSLTRRTEDPDWRGETGYLQEQLADGRLARISGVPFDPAACHVFLCGNPSMIVACVELLGERGFTERSPKNPEGRIHLEGYW